MHVTYKLKQGKTWVRNPTPPQPDLAILIGGHFLTLKTNKNGKRSKL